MTKYNRNWDLDSLYPHPESAEFATIFGSLADDLKALADRSRSLPPVCAEDACVAHWRTFLMHYQDTDSRMGELNSFIGCHAAAHANSKLFQQFEARLAQLAPLREQIATNLELALQSAGDDDFNAFCTGHPDLARIQFFLEQSRRKASLRLPGEQELLAAQLGVDGIHGWGRLYDRVSADLRIEVMERGEIVRRSPGQVQFDSPQRAVRENNFFAADRAWRSIADTCADALNHIAGTRLTLYRRIGIDDHLVVPLRVNRMQRETLEAMWAAVTDRKSVLVKYLRHKAELLGLEQPAWYDVHAPLSAANAGATLEYDEACDTVVRTLTAFNRDVGEFAERAISDRWIESENRSGKRQGGFCTGFAVQRQSRIFMTYTDSADSMSTLAHELGHAWHSHVLRNEPIVLQEYPMNLAETASTFAEAVLGADRLRTVESVEERRQILDHMLSDAVAFLMNIHARFLFEDRFHRERVDGELTVDRLDALMLAAQKEAYLDALSDDGWHRSFWISKLHFYISTYPFYNFPYTFGYLLSLGLFALADDGSEAFPDQYRRFLIATGCCEAEDAVTTTFGYDLREPDFWNRSLDVVEQRVTEFLDC